MKQLIAAMILSLLLVGCQTGGTWTARQLGAQYIGLKKTDSRFLSPLYYQGTDEKFHYFMFRSIDTWVPVKVRKAEIEMADIRPHLSISQAKAFPGYYAVDPERGFAKVIGQKDR